MQKGIASIISFVMIAFISVITLAAALYIGLPEIEKFQEFGRIEEARGNLVIFDTIIRGLATEGLGITKSAQFLVTDGIYRVDPDSGTLDYTLGLKSDVLPKGATTKDGNIITSVSGSASATENSSHIILENEILEVVLRKVGSETSFATINTSNIISTVKSKIDDSYLSISDTSIKVSSNPTSGWGNGYSKVVREGSNLPNAEALTHVRSSLSGLEYDVLYTLPASSDFLIVSLRNISAANMSSFIFRYKIGASSNDIVRVGVANQSTFEESTNADSNQTRNLQNTNYTTNTSSITLTINIPIVYYNASDGSWRNASELSSIGQGNWSSTSSQTQTTITFTLAGRDGWDYAIRDAYPGGSYWLDENGRSLDSGLVGYWKLAEGKGSVAYDSSGNNRRGTLTTSPAWISNSSCVLATCLRFNGSNYVTFGDVSAVDGLSQITVSAWFNSTPSSNYRSIVTKGYSTGNVFELKMVRDSEGPRVFFRITTSAGTASASLPQAQWSITNNEWHHVAGTYDGNYVRLYFDGALIVSTLHNGTMASNSKALMIGSTDDGAAERFVGLIDEVRIYDRALSEDEIKRLRHLSGIKIQNDFLTTSMQPYTFMNLTNYTGGTIFLQALESIKVDDNPITSNYSVNDTTVYFFDWKENDWKVWMKNTDNVTHGFPDWLDPRFKEIFKWRQEFRKIGMPNINITYMMTAHDPFVRTFVDTEPIGYTSVVDNSTIALWQFNEGSDSTSRDESGDGNSLSWTNPSSNATWITNSTCVVGNCLSFDGSDDFVQASNEGNFDFTKDSALSASFWMKAVGQSNKAIIAKNTELNGNADGWSIWLQSDPYINFEMTATVTTDQLRKRYSDSRISDGSWHFYTWTYDGSSSASGLKLFVDGTEVVASTVADTLTSSILNNNLVTIGAISGGTNNLNGRLDEVRIWNRVLTPEEISKEYQRGLNHNISIPISFGMQKTYDQVYEEGSGAWKPNQDQPNTYNLMIYNISGRSLYKIDGSAPNLASAIYIAKPTIAFHNKVANDNVVFVTPTWQAGSGKHKDFELSWNDSDGSGKWDKVMFNYKFNATWNSNFMFSLGHGTATTSSWVATNTPYTCSATTFCGTYTGFSNESFAEIGNSSLTYYDLRDDSLMAWWKFNEGSGLTATDLSGNGRTAYLKSSNITWASQAKFGSGVVTNRSVNSFLTTNSINLGSTYTLSSWIKTNMTGATQTVISKESGATGSYMLALNSNGQALVVHLSGSACTGTTNLANNQWHHIAGTLDDKNYKVYVDGVLQRTCLSGVIRGFDTTNTSIGDGAPVNDTLGFNGTIDNVKLYSRPLSADEIKSDYLAAADDYPNFGKTSQADGAMSIPTVSFYYDGGALGIWKLDEGSGINATDSSGNGNMGKINSATWVVNSSCKIGACVKFDGSSSNVTIPDNSIFTIPSDGSLSQFAWIRTKSASSDRIIISGYDGSTEYYGMSLNAGSLQVSMRDANNNEIVANTNKNLSDDIWHHVGWVKDGSNIKIFVDGNRTMTVSDTTNAAINPPSGLVVGRCFGTCSNFDGLMDEVRIYARVLTESEVREHYQTGASKYYDDFGTAANGRTYRYIGVEDSNTTLQPIAPNGTVLHFRFNDNSTINATDVSGYGNNGGLYGGGLWIANASCKENFRGCTSLDGTNDYVKIPTSSSLNLNATGRFTMSAWVNFRSVGARQVIVSYHNVYPTQLEGRATGTINALLTPANLGGGTDIGTSSNYVEPNKWYHVASTYDGSTFRLYVNGTQVASGSHTTGVATATTATYIGTYNNVEQYLNGTVDEVMILNHHLSADEIYQLYLGGMNRTVNDRWHRVVSADDLNSVSLNLTDHNNTLTLQGYDMRLILANGTFFNASSPRTGCYNLATLQNPYVCSQDSLEFTTAKSAGLVYPGNPSLFSSLCNDEESSNYVFNLTARGSSQVVMPFADGVCTVIGNKTSTITSQGIPSGPFGSYLLGGLANLLMRLQYENIKLEGDLRLVPGSHEVCFKKIRQEGARIVINVTNC